MMRASLLIRLSVISTVLALILALAVLLGISIGSTGNHLKQVLAILFKGQPADGVLATGSLSESVAAKAGIGDRDVIREIDGTKIVDLDHFRKVYEELTKKEPKKVVMKILQGGRTPRFLVMDLTKAKKKSGEAAEEK